MSYPSIKTILEQQHINLETATKQELENSLWQAFETDLALGVQYLQSFATKVRETGKRLLNVENPNSPLGKQLIRLLGTDIARTICEKRFGIFFGFYNCCSPVGAPTKKLLSLSMKEQIQLQNGDVAHADC